MAKDSEEVNKLTFKPKISDNTHILMKDKVEERYKDVNRFKEEMILRLRDKYNMDKDMTFKPKILEISDRVATMKYQGKGVVERLIDHGEDIAKKKALLASEVNQEIAKECSFYPSVNYQGNDQVSYTTKELFRF